MTSELAMTQDTEEDICWQCQHHRRSTSRVDTCVARGREVAERDLVTGLVMHSTPPPVSCRDMRQSQGNTPRCKYYLKPEAV